MSARMTTMAVGAIVVLFAGSPSVQAVALDNSVSTFARTSSQSGIVSARQAEELGLAAYAAVSGESIEQLREYVAGQDNFGEDIARIQGIFPHDYVTALWDGPTSPNTAVYVRAAARESVERGFPELRVVASDLLTAERRAEAEEALIEAAVVLPGVDIGSAHIDPFTNAATITFSLKAASATANAAFADSLTRTVNVVAASFGVTSVTVTEIEASLAAPEYYSGGNWNSRCTAGFTGKRRGVTAMTTVAHCASVRAYQGASLYSRVNSSVRGGDVTSYLARGAKITNSVRVGWAKWTLIRRVWDPPVGSLICHFGIATGYTCAKVLKINQVVNFKGIGVVGKIAVVNNTISKPGDSGGPWYWGNISHGLHMGTCASLGGSCFSQITALNPTGTAIFKG